MRESALTALLERHASNHRMPGAAVGILRDGVATTGYFGVADLSTGAPVTADTRFSIGSLTKSMVATVVARLAAAGRLTLEDPASVRVHELRGIAWAERATVRDLLANRSGLPLRDDLEFGFEARQDRDDLALSRLATDVATAEPADAFWSYSNVGWCLLGRVIEITAHATWEDAMRRYLFDSAGMDQTTFATEDPSVPRASGHTVTADGPRAAEPLVSRAYGPAGASVISTMTDLLRFAALHLEDSSLAALRAVHGEVAIHGWLDSWCLGWAKFDWDGGPVWGWDGLINGERSVLRILPEHHAAVVLLTNSSHGRAMYQSLFTELMPSAFGITLPPLRLQPTADAPTDLSPYAGVYGWPDRQVHISASASTLRITSESGETEARPIDSRTFVVDPDDPDNPTLTFQGFDTVGRPTVLYDMLWGLPRLNE
jgi:CubicO group peptidase (beta-lactamase class C family)